MKHNLIIFSFILFICFSCSRTENTAQKEFYQTVRIDTVRSHGEDLTMTFPGKIKAASDINLSFRVAGPILSIPVNEGDFVKKGQVIARIDPRDYEIQLAATEAEYKQIKGEVERIVELYQQESVSKNNYEKAIYGLEQITAKYNAHKNALEDTKLLAPFDGYIQKLIYDEKETVGAGMPIITMINNSAPEVEINIPSSEYLRRDSFESFSCVVTNYAGITFPLEMIGITKMANLNQLYKVRLKMKPVNGAILPTPGITANVKIEFKPEASNLTIIPLSAMFQHEELSCVWVYNPNNKTVSLRHIKPMEVNGDGSMVVSEGLEAGELIVTAGVNSLSDNQKVEPLKPISKTNIGGLL